MAKVLYGIGRFFHTVSVRILLITRYFPPLEGIATVRMRSFAERWADLGHRVVVLTTAKAIAGEYRYPGIEVCAVEYFDPITSFSGEQLSGGGGRSWLKRFYRRRMNERMPHRIDFWISKAKKALGRWESFDLIVSSYGPYAPHLVALEAKKRFQAPWIADFRDLWCDNHTYSGLWPFTLLERRLERKVCEAADLLTTVSEGLQKQLQIRFPNAKVALVRNGFNANAFPIEIAPLKRPFHFLYAGTLYEKGHDLPTFLEGVRGVKGNFHIEFVGTVTAAFEEGERVTYSGRVSPEEALRRQLQADALLFLDYQFKGYDGILSGKIYEYLYAGKPILAVGVAEESELGRLLTSTGGALFCRNTASSISEGIEKIMRGEVPPQKRAEVMRYSRAAQADAIISLARECSQRVISDS